MGRAGIGVRLTAGLIDALAVILLYWIFELIFFPSLANSDTISSYYAKARGAMSCGALLVIGYSLMDVFLRATPGKLLFKLRVTNAVGNPATQGQLWMRWLYRWGFLGLYLIYGISLMPSFLIANFMAATAVFTLFMMMLSRIGWAIYDGWVGTSVTQLGYLQLPQGLGRIIYWNPATDAPAAVGGFPVTPNMAAPAGPIPTMPPMPAVPVAAGPIVVGPIAVEVPGTVALTPAGSGAPVGDIPTRVAARRPVDQGAIPLEEIGSVPPPPPGNPV